MFIVISYQSKVMLLVILHRLTDQAERILKMEQSGLRSQRSTTEQIFNLSLLMEKHLEHKTDICNNFIDFKKTPRKCCLARWRLASLERIQRQQVIRSLYDK